MTVKELREIREIATNSPNKYMCNVCNMEVVALFSEIDRLTAELAAKSDMLNAAIAGQETLQRELAAEKVRAEAVEKRADAAVADLYSVANAINNSKQKLSGGEEYVRDLKLGRCDVCQHTCQDDNGCRFKWNGNATEADQIDEALNGRR